MGEKDLLYMVIIPMNMSAELVKEMDFYSLFQNHFASVYGLELSVKETSEDRCEIIFKGVEDAISAVIEVLKEMGLAPTYKQDYSKYLDGDPNDYH